MGWKLSRKMLREVMRWINVDRRRMGDREWVKKIIE